MNSQKKRNKPSLEVRRKNSGKNSRNTVLLFFTAFLLSLSFHSCEKSDETGYPVKPGDSTSILKKASSIKDLEEWLGTDPYSLGCHLETSYGQTDPDYNCKSTPTTAAGEDVDLQLNDESMAMIDKRIETVHFFWKNRKLVSIQVNIKDKEKNSAIGESFQEELDLKEPYCKEEYNCIIFSKKFD